MTTVVIAMLCAPMRSLADGQDQVSRLWAALGLLQWLAPRAHIGTTRAIQDRRSDRHGAPTPKVSLGECAYRRRAAARDVNHGTRHRAASEEICMY